MYRPTNQGTRRRLTFFAALLVSALVVLLARLWFVQVAAGERYASLAESGRVRDLTLEAPRGRILDRHGRVLVENRPVHVVGVRTDEMGGRRAEVLADLETLLGLRTGELRDRIAAADDDTVQTAPIAFDVPERVALYVWEHQSTRFPGVYADRVLRRSYPRDRVASHTVGYTGEVTSEQLDTSEYRDVPAGAQVGLAGVERTYDAVLRGRAGSRSLEIDARGAVIRQVGERLPTPGADLALTLDLDIQRLVESELAAGLRRAGGRRDREGRGDGTFAAPAGAAVVLDPTDGAVRAMASLPTFEPGDFVGGISQDRYAELIAPGAHAPLLNRAIQATYPPGSVFKIVSTAAALRHGFATPTSTLPCPGSWRWSGSGQRFRNWIPADQGAMTLTTALIRSCDTVFYELAERMWTAEERRGGTAGYMTAEARRFGYGAALGIDLPGERAGIVPDRAWRKSYWQDHRESYCAGARRATDRGARALLTELCGPDGARWRGGDAVNLSIGQGDLLASPLQVATSLSVVANGGTIWRPRVAAAVHHVNGEIDDIPARAVARSPLDAEALAVLRDGLEGVTAPGGTAANALSGAALPVAGKSGTAESSTQPFAWFAGYAPAAAPRYVVAVVLEEGGGGSGAAGPIVRGIVDGLAELERGR